jgi:hypothetical protein
MAAENPGINQIEESTKKITFEERLQKHLQKESVRHGVFPWFTVDRKAKELKFGELDNDIAQDAFYEAIDDYGRNKNPNMYGHCRSDWSRSMCIASGKQALELVKQGKTNAEIDKLLGFDQDIY